MKRTLKRVSGVVEKKNEKSLIVECQSIFAKQVREPSLQVIQGYWEIGSKFIEYEAEGWIERKRGDETVKRVAEGLHIPFTSMYAAITFATRFPLKKDLKQLVSDIREHGHDPSWNHVRYNVLPKNAGLSEEDKANELMSEGERAAQRVEDVVQELRDMDGEEADGVREALQSSLQESVTQLVKPKGRKRARDANFLKWIHEQPEFVCIVTGSKEDLDACHVRTRGAGGSDYWVFPLKHEIHMEQHKDSSFWGRYKQEVVEWFYNLSVLHQRYFAEQGK